MFENFFYTQHSRILYRKGEKFHTGFEDLRDMLGIALIYGWKPLGTVNPEVDEWEGSSLRSYLLDANQLVTHEDALNLADALSKSLTDNFRNSWERSLGIYCRAWNVYQTLPGKSWILSNAVSSI